jgi:hypothetical protein
MTITVPQSRLILRTIMATLRNNLAASQMIEWEMHSTEMNDRNGFVVSEQVGPDYVITETNGAVADLTSGVQDTVFGSQTFTLNKVFGMSMGASDIESVTDLGSARKARALNNGIARLASKIDAHIFDVAAQAFPYSTGVWGTDLTDPEEVSAARTRLAEASIESDMGISAAFTHRDRQKLAKFIYSDTSELASEASRAMRNGFSGMIDNVPLMPSNQLGRITTGTRTNGTIAGAAQNVNYVDVADSGANAGRYMTQTLALAGLGAAGTIKAGEVFSIANVVAWDPEIGAARPFNAQFTVLADATADGAGAATVTIFPAIIVQTGTTVVNNAHATVNVAPANGAVVTFLGSAATTYTPRVMFKKEAIVCHSAPLILPYTGQGFRRSLADAKRDGQAPIMPRLWMYSDPNTGAHRARVDVFVQAQARNRWMGVKFFGGGL